MDKEQVVQDENNINESFTNNAVDPEVSVQNMDNIVGGNGTVDENLSNDEFNAVSSFNTIQNSIEAKDDFSKPEFSDGSESVDEDSSNVIKEVEEVKVKPKKKINITLVVIIGIVVLFGGVMLLMNQGTSGNNVFQGEGEGEEETIVVKTGTEWGNKYLAYMMKEKPNLTTYEISFVNVNTSSEPEMFLKYKDNNGVDTLKMLYIADGDVYETKYYHNYKLRYIYSLQEKGTHWYIFISTNKNYGNYTKISKIIDKMAFDADIKTTNDSELIEYGKKYFDSDYQLVFYTVKEGQHEENYRTFITKYDTYDKQMKDVASKLFEKYKDVEYVPDKPEDSPNITFGGREYYYGNYYASIPAKEDVEGSFPHTAVLTFNKNKTIIIEGILYNYEYVSDGLYFKLYSNEKEVGSVSLYQSGIFSFKGVNYSYKK
jgi:hypothetical protein